MKIEEIMTFDVPKIHPGAPLSVASQKMQKNNVPYLAVMEQGALVGIITEREITVKATTSESDPDKDIVADSMVLSVITCGPEDDSAGVMSLMKEKEISQILVVNPKQDHTRGTKLMGAVSLKAIESLMKPPMPAAA
jgi:CBS domain-containing protein